MLKTKRFILALLAALPLMMFTGCDNNSTIGGELVGDEVEVLVDSSFTISGSSVRTQAVLSRTVMQMIGIIDAPDYGYISSDVVTQFMPANVLETDGVTVNDIDSIKLVMLVPKTGFVGDSLALMGLDVYPLTRQLSTPMYSDFNPEGYYDPSKKIASTIYNLSKKSEPDSLLSNNFYTIDVPLPLELGREFFEEFITNPATFASPTAFAKFFPGLYISNSFGSGRITRIGNTTMQMHYRQNTKNDAGRDTTYYKTGTYFAVTPEIITNNDITLDIASEINQKVDDGNAILLAPAGLEVELSFPAREIISVFNNGTTNALGVVNTLTFQLPLEPIENKYNIGMPEEVLLVLKKDRDDFFLQNKLPDDITSFRSTLSRTSDGSYVYAFNDMRQYLLDLMAKDTIADEDVTFMLVPITLQTESNNDYYGNATNTVTAITPYVTEPKMAKILVEKAKINFIYTRQTTKF